MTKYQAVRREVVINSSKKAANFYLSTFKWNDQQRAFLSKVAQHGYAVAQYNKIRRLFGMPQSTDGDRDMIMTVNLTLAGSKRKRDIQIFAL